MFLDRTDVRVAEEVCADGRALLKTIAAKSGVSTQTVSSRLKRLERELGLKYVPEIDLPAVGMRSEHFVRMKLSGEPDGGKLKAALAMPNVQLACRTAGDFDLLLWVIARDARAFAREAEPELRDALGDWAEDWVAHALVARTAGFIPVSAHAVELFSLPKSRKKTLAALSENSRMAVTALADELGVTEPTAEYHLKKAKPFIRRYTAYFSGKGEFAHVARFLQLKGRKTDARDAERALASLFFASDPRLFNRLAFAASCSGGMDAAFLETYSPLEDSAGSESREALTGVKAVGKQAVGNVVKILKGAIPVRKVRLAEECPYLISPPEAGEQK